MSESPSPDRPIVVCPLEYEREALARAGIDEHADLVRAGAGADSMVRWAEGFGESGRLVILAGLAGALRKTVLAGTAHWATTVIDPRGKTVQCSVKGSHGVVLASSPTVLTTPREKHAFAERTGAELVDLESAAFALAGTILGWRWAIVRGVSDAAADHLPSRVGSWVHSDGTTNARQIWLSLARGPWDVTRLPRMARQSRDAMRAVAEKLAAFL